MVRAASLLSMAVIRVLTTPWNAVAREVEVATVCESPVVSVAAAVESEAALAGVLGTVGNSIVTKQAAKVTAEFARNLERALSGDAAPEVAPRPETAAITAPHAAAPPARDPWVKVAALFSVAATVIGLIILIKGLV